MAQKTYSCNNCNRSPIFPGDVYRGEVFAHNKRIIVMRYHVMPHCDDFPDPDEVRRIFEEMDRQRESPEGPVQENAPLREAA